MAIITDPKKKSTPFFKKIKKIFKTVLLGKVFTFSYQFVKIESSFYALSDYTGGKENNTSKYVDKNPSDTLYKAFLTLKTEEECRQFMEDLCTVSELKAMEQRIEVATLLDKGMIYSEILEQTGASSATISRVNRCLQYGAGGYRTVLPRLKNDAE